MERRFPLIIIGAGISGLTIASNLEEEFLVLEARDRIGGRVWSREYANGSYTLDVGAAWIHGSTDNPLNQYLKYEEMIPVSESNPWIHTGKAKIAYEGITDEERQQMIIEWNRVAKEISQMTCETIADALSKLEGFYNYNIKSFIYLLEVWCGASISSMPPSFLRNMECDDSLFGDYAGSHCLFKNGTNSLITSIVEKSKHDLKQHILFEQIVTDILYDRDDGLVEVWTQSGAIYLCEKLIITIPPGPLRNINFVPPLSESRKCALSKIKMGSYKKIQMEFESVFWDTNSDMILTTRKSDYIPYILWNNYACLKGVPILEAVCPANIGWQLTGKTDEEIADAVLIHMRGMYPWMPDPVS